MVRRISSALPMAKRSGSWINGHLILTCYGACSILGEALVYEHKDGGVLMSDLVRETQALLNDRYDVYNYNHALEILSQAFPSEHHELIDVLNRFELSTLDIMSSGGNESQIPKKIVIIITSFRME
jgi:hypothetical protein